MNFTRMELEEWFDKYQYVIENNIGESSVACVNLLDLGVELGRLPIRYGFHGGNPRLRAAIAELYPGLSADNVLVTNGAAEALFLLAACLCAPCDHVVVQHPNYPSNYEVPRSLGCEVDLIRLEASKGFSLDLPELEARVRSGTKFMSLTYPNNPTGAVADQNTILRLVDLAEKRGTWLILDETYRELSFGEPVPPAATLGERAISVSTVSKAYGIPGARLGWIATKSRDLLDRVLAAREQFTICNSVIGEEVALAALLQRETLLARSKRLIAENYSYLRSWVGDRGWLQWSEPRGGVVCLLKIDDGTLEDPEKLYVLLAEDFGTFVIPGRCFELSNHFFRIGYGGDHQELRRGLDSIDKAVGLLTGGTMVERQRSGGRG